MRIQVVAQIKVVREAVASRFGLLPPAALVLSLNEPLHAAHNVVAYIVLACQQPDYRPRRLRGGTAAAPAPGGVLIGERAFAPAPVGILFGLEPFDCSLDLGCVQIDADCAQPGESRKRAVNVRDAPSPPPGALRRLVAL